MSKIITMVVVLLRFSDSKLVGPCNRCLASNNVACLNENHFSICFRGSATATITRCPDEYVCTSDERICRRSDEVHTPICYNEYCGECEITNGIFACVDDVTYGYCFGANTPLDSTLRSCPPGFVCNHNHREICMPEETTMPSCTGNTTSTEISTEISTIPTGRTSDETTLTPTTQMPIEASSQETAAATETTARTEPLDADTICGQIGQNGYFKSAADATCRQYVYCYLLSGQYLGWFYYCEFYFNAVTQKCQEERPPDCVAY